MFIDLPPPPRHKNSDPIWARWFELLTERVSQLGSFSGIVSAQTIATGRSAVVVAVSGARAGANVIASAAFPGGVFIVSAEVTAANEVTLQLQNVNGSGTAIGTTALHVLTVGP